VESLSGKTAVVTGAGSGIGRALALRFARAGTNVVMADVEDAALARAGADVAAAAAAAGAAVTTRHTDVSRFEEVIALRDHALERFGAVQIVCNNAGVGAPGTCIEDWQWVVGVNLYGVVHGHLAFLPHLLDNDEGHIVNTSSLSGLLAVAGAGPYIATKHAVVGLSEALYHDLARRRSRVGVSCLCPYYVATNITTSERNRPAELSPESAGHDGQPARSARQEDMIAQGQDPSEVADLVGAAILENRFWIFTSDEPRPYLESRCESILSGTNPTRRPTVAGPPP
jgi:NAD(P)-dependent dehydrogenase (short-subunit alcohol dehydrogenase family)